jgi:hypothetical protein
MSTNINDLKVGYSAAADSAGNVHIETKTDPLYTMCGIPFKLGETVQVDQGDTTMCKACEAAYIKATRCVFDQMLDGDLTNEGSFLQSLANAFIAASGDSRKKLATAFPEYFEGSRLLS